MRRAPRVSVGVTSGRRRPPGRAGPGRGPGARGRPCSRGCRSPALVPSAASAAASAIEAPDASAFSTAVARSGVEPMLTSATAVSLHGHADDGPVDRPLGELLERPGGRAGGLGHLDLREQFARLERGLEDALEELRGGHRPRPVLAADHERGVQREQRGGQVGGRVGVRDRAADRAPVPDLRVAHGLGRVREQRDVGRAAAPSWPRRGAWSARRPPRRCPRRGRRTAR